MSTSDLETCVRCGLCLSACPTFELTGMEGYSPRGRIATAKAMADGRTPGPAEAEYLDTCLGCRACEDVCPSGVPYGRIFEEARASLRPRTTVVGRVLLWAAKRRWRLSVLSLPVWVAQRIGLMAVLRVLPSRTLRSAAALPRLRLADLTTRMSTRYVPPELTDERGEVVLFTGCVQDAWARDVHWATIFVLTRLGYVVRVPHGQVCCGALHAHAGRSKEARSLAIVNMQPLERHEGAIVVNAAGCGAKLREYGHVLDHPDAVTVAERVRDPSELVDVPALRALRPRPPAGLGGIALHDPCHLTFGQGVLDAPREALAAAGYDVAVLADRGRCCGAAGMYSLAQPAFAEPLRQAKLDAISETGAAAAAVGNPGCAFWLAAGDGAGMMYHPMQLLAMAISGAEERGQDVGESHEV